MKELLTFILAFLSAPVFAATIFHGDFEGTNWLQRFNSIQQPPWTQGMDRATPVGDPQKHKSVLQIRYPAKGIGPNQSGAQWLTRLGKSYEELTLSYEIKVAKDFEFVLGGKLPGLIGGHQEGDPDSTVTGGAKPTGKNGWSARIMWRKNGDIVQYLYHPDQKGKWGDDLAWILNGKPARFIPGKWHTVKTEIIMNAAGQKNGIIRAWLDGTKTLEVTNLRFRDTPNLGIDALYFSTFYGGEDPEWAPKNETKIYFDNFTITD